MAIKDTNILNEAEQQGAIRQEAAPGFNPNVGIQPQASSKDGFKRGGLFTSPLPATVGTEYFNKFKDSLIETFKQAKPIYEIKVIPVDREQGYGLYYSCVVIAVRDNNKLNLGVSAHVLILAKSNTPPAPVEYTYAGIGKVENFRTPDAAWDKAMYDIIRTVLHKEYGENTPIVIADATVIPEDFDINNQMAIHEVALNAGMADVTTLLSREKGYQDINLTYFKNIPFKIDVTFPHTDEKDIVGNMVRSDVVMQMGENINETQQRQNQSLNVENSDTTVSKATGFIDLLPVALPPQNMYAPAPTQKYVARYVMTSLANSRGQTPGMILMALASINSLVVNNNWYQTFTPRMVPGLDTKDIGALPIMANPDNDPKGYGEYLDVKSAQFTLPDIGRLLNTLVQDGLIIAMDVPDAGPETWYTSIFADAEKKGQSALNALVEAANTLTAGKFSSYFNMDARFDTIFSNHNNRVQLGKFQNSDGVWSDLRNIDMLYLANTIGKTAPDQVRRFMDIELMSSIDPNLRLSEYRKFIKLLVPNCVFTGMATRLTFSAPFINALLQGIADIGINMSIRTPNSAAEFSNNQGYVTYAASALVAPNQGFIRNTVGPQTVYSNTPYRSYSY